MQTLGAILIENGLPDLQWSLIEAHRNREGIWRIKFCYELEPSLSMNQAQAAALVVQLQLAGEKDCAEEIYDAVNRAKRYSAM